MTTSSLAYNFSKIMADQKEFFYSGITRELDYRLEQLQKLRTNLQAWEPEIKQALKKDFGKADVRSFSAIYREIDVIESKLAGWSADKRQGIFSKNSINKPFGTILLLPPWQSALTEIFIPLIGAIAAGNTIVVQLPEETVHLQKNLTLVIEEIFPANYISVINGSQTELETLLELPWDFVYFKGPRSLASKVQEKTAKNLTPARIDTGSKNPCIVDATAKISLAARQIARGKFIHAGQSLFSPDYLLVDKSIQLPFIKALISEIQKHWGEAPLEHQDYYKIVNAGYFSAFKNAVSPAHLVYGGSSNEDRRFITPTVLNSTNNEWDLQAMSLDFTGPLLPIFYYTSHKEALYRVRHFNRPRILYLFSDDNEFMNKAELELNFTRAYMNAIPDEQLMDVQCNCPAGTGTGNTIQPLTGKANYDCFSQAVISCR